MEKEERIGYIIAIVGGIGLGLLIGSEFSGREITVIGAVFAALSLLATVILTLKKSR